MRCLFALTAILLASHAFAQDIPAPQSIWRGAQAVRRGGQIQPLDSCLEIIGPSSPLTGGASTQCVQISGRITGSGFGSNGIVSGYACPEGNQFNFFAGVGSDNSLGPDIFVGSYSFDAISGSYFARSSNDPNASYDDKLELEWHRAPACRP
jgi:hypothetical protein